MDILETDRDNVEKLIASKIAKKLHLYDIFLAKSTPCARWKLITKTGDRHHHHLSWLKRLFAKDFVYSDDMYFDTSTKEKINASDLRKMINDAPHDKSGDLSKVIWRDGEDHKIWYRNIIYLMWENSDGNPSMYSLVYMMNDDYSATAKMVTDLKSKYVNVCSNELVGL